MNLPWYNFKPMASILRRSLNTNIPKMSRTILVTGATGKQGGAVVNALLAANADFQILALTRDAQSASAQRLAKKSPNIKLVMSVTK